MHRALLIRDIQNLIFDNLEQGDLARLARTCKTLEEPALQRLWASATFIELRRLANLGNIYSHVEGRAPIPKECPRLKKYVQLVRHADLEVNLNQYWTAVVYTLLERRSVNRDPKLGPTIILPNLATLKANVTGLPHLMQSQVRHFVTEGLFRLSITYGDPSHAQGDWDLHLAQFLDHVSMKCQHLQDLEIIGTAVPESEMLDASLAILIDSNPDLLHFKANTSIAGPETMRSLSFAPRLQYLIIEDKPSDSRPLQLITVEEQTFKGLRNLVMTDCSIEEATILLSLAECNLSNLVLQVYIEEQSFIPVEELSHALRAVGRYMKTVSITIKDKSSEYRQRPLSLYPTLLSVLCDTNCVQDFTFKLQSPTITLDLRDDDLERMADAWPDLRTFSITWTPPRRPPRRAGVPIVLTQGGLLQEDALTLNCIVPFVERCRLLEKFSLTSLTAAVHYRHRSLLPTSLNSLTLSVGRAEIEDAESVAQFLHAVLPNVKLYHNGMGYRALIWAEVQQELVRLKGQGAEGHAVPTGGNN